jgi:hypothetical protein
MRIDFRRSVFLSIGLVVSGTLLTSDLLAAPGSASAPGGPVAYHGRTVDREAIARDRIVRRQRATRWGTRSRIVPAPPPATSPRSWGTLPNPRGGDDVWRRLRNCEAGGRYDANSGNGYYGAYQFSAGTWRSLGYGGLPHQAPSEIQDEAARKLQARSGWGQWPACSRRIGVRR